MRKFIDLIEAAQQSIPLYHGTSVLNFIGILKQNAINGYNDGDYDDAFSEEGVSLSSDKNIAARFATDRMDRVMSEFLNGRHFREYKGVILEFEQNDLSKYFDLIKDGFNTGQQEELEVRVLGNINNVKQHMARVDISKDEAMWCKQIIEEYVKENPEDRTMSNDLADFYLLEPYLQ